PASSRAALGSPDSPEPKAGSGHGTARPTAQSGTPDVVRQTPRTHGATRAFVFPVRPPSRASFGRVHHDYPATDVFADCGSAVVSPVDGVVQELSRVDRWDPATDRGAQRGGLFVSIVTDDGMRFYGSHLRSIGPGVTPGVRVRAGERLARVGRTGSAAPTACHLHVGISPDCGPGDWAVRRGVVPPWRYLESWQAGGDRSPAAALRHWQARNDCSG
ncbi:MAG: M23 family metallopeptidase, partial [Actinomycetes bacterium]